jgi:hypothetical protein
VNSLAGAIDVLFQLSRQGFPIRTDHPITASTLACHFHAVASDSGTT